MPKPLSDANTAGAGGKKRRPLRLAGLVLSYLVFALLMALLIFLAVMRAQNKIAMVGGMGLARVATGSMEPDLHVGDYIGVRTVDPSDIQVLDIVVFFSDEDIDGDGKAETVPLTHRVVRVDVTQSGARLFTTRGDANPNEDAKKRTEEDIIGVCTGRLAILSAVGGFLSDPWVFFALVLVPAIIFFLAEFISFVRKRALLELERETEKQKTQADREEKAQTKTEKEEPQDGEKKP